mgnify:FL=1|jgi:hypothetical protein
MTVVYGDQESINAYNLNYSNQNTETLVKNNLLKNSKYHIEK